MLTDQWKSCTDGPPSTDQPRSLSPISPASKPHVPHRSKNKTTPTNSAKKLSTTHLTQGDISLKPNAKGNIKDGSPIDPSEIHEVGGDVTRLKLEKSNDQNERSSSPQSSDSRGCSPLYFTYEDYKMVMEESARPQVLNIKYNVSSNKESKQSSNERSNSPITENVVFKDVREEIYFRITTTDRPFEKCPEEWTNEKHYRSEDGPEEDSDSHIFEDYMDRNNRLIARPTLLFSEDLRSTDQDGGIPIKKTATRVRFLIEAPSTDTPDLDFDDDGTSYGAFVDRQLKQGSNSTVELVEVTDGEIAKCDDDSMKSILNEETSNTERDSVAIIEEIIPPSEDVTTSEPCELDGFCLEWDEDAEVYSPSLPPVIKKKIAEDTPLATKNVEKGESQDIRVRDEDKRSDSFIDRKSKCKDSLESVRCQEILNRKRILVDSSLYNIPNENTDGWRQFHYKEGNHSPLAQSFCDTTSECYDDDTIDERPEIETNQMNEKPDSDVEPVPQSVRRNSFLETMLDNDKQLPRSVSDIPPPNCRLITSRTKQSEARVDVRVNDKQKKDPIQHTGKSAGQVKGDVLSELLTNFSNIKLKPVNDNSTSFSNTGSHHVECDSFSSERKRESTNNLEKSAGSSQISRSESNETLLTHSGARAIVKETSYEERKDNDNKAIASSVSNQNLLEAVPIKPGSVKNFVKYYEIHTEISNIAKIEENLFKCRKISPVRDSNKNMVSDTSVKANKETKGPRLDAQSTKTHSSVQRKGLKNKKSEGATAENQNSPITSNKNVSPQKESCLKGSVASPKFERRKNVQFDSGCKVIDLRAEEVKTVDKNIPTSFPDEDNCKSKSSSATDDLGSKVALLGGLKESHHKELGRNAAVIQDQDPSEPEADCARRSGNRSPLHIPSTLPDQTIVFYCTL
ncbi:hypothetical protein QAD02_010441 [Eretmocerus hayati]|uniref:Uncharacterized protein n=1 Tax=Eretmocerus hayati TaxID=131215 RepID=A0ACC2NYM7_9HYME|nr:hypothetical protein QAD02_010441 [Eretmocerus hayati]